MEFLSSCKEMAVMVQDAIEDLAGNPGGGEVVGMGADGTPTKKIDLVAEDCIISYMHDHPLCRTLISEEAGVVSMEGDAGTVFLDPVDGTFNAIAGIPFYALSFAYAEHGRVEKAFVKNLAMGETVTAVRGKGAALTVHHQGLRYLSLGPQRDEYLREEI